MKLSVCPIYCDLVKPKRLHRCGPLPNFGSLNIILWCTRFPNTSNYNGNEHTAYLILFGWNVRLCKCSDSLCRTYALHQVIVYCCLIIFPRILFSMDVLRPHGQMHDQTQHYVLQEG